MLDMLEAKNMHNEIDVLHGNNSYAALDHGPNNDGMGVCVSTGYGDGYYGVYVKRSNDGVWGTRIAEAKVVFIPKDTDEDDEDFYDSDGDYDGDEEE